MDEPEYAEAMSLATATKSGIPSVRIVLLKALDDRGFVFYTNLESQKGNEIKENPKASMCFHWKSLRRQVRVIGKVEEVTSKEADDYYNSRPYKNRISAWASSQSQILDKRETFLNKIIEYEKKYPDENNVPRPKYWTGFVVTPIKIEFWQDMPHRIHDRLVFEKLDNSIWKSQKLFP